MHDLLFSYILGMWSSLCKEYFSDNFTIIKNNTSNKKWLKKGILAGSIPFLYGALERNKNISGSCMKGEKNKHLYKANTKQYMYYTAYLLNRSSFEAGTKTKM